MLNRIKGALGINVMSAPIDLQKLSRDEKLRMMEALWEDLSREDVALPSPDWHQQALQETEARAASGQETPLDWEDAKKDLRKKLL